MKTLLQIPILLLLLLISGSVISQRRTTPTNIDTIQCDLFASGFNDFRVLPLQPDPLDTFAYYSFLWWSGDNVFSFDSTPNHAHYETIGNNIFPANSKMTAITTENYGSGGPPPLTYTFSTLAPNIKQKTPVIPSGNSIHVQTYRNAVIRDVMYLIVSYSNPQSDPNNASGILRFDFGDYAELATNVFSTHPHFFPNLETWNAANNEVEFHSLKPGEERSILIPVFIKQNEEEVLNMSVTLLKNKSSEVGNPIEGIHIYSLSPTVAQSHDPNQMIQYSDAKNNCDYRNGKIHYTTKFQNVGDKATEYVRVECFLDDKVNMDSITGISFPEQCRRFREGSIFGHYEPGKGAIYHIDKDNRKIIFEMHDLILQGTGDLQIPHLDLSRDQIEFDIYVKHNYVFGPPTTAYSVIYFDSHEPITTNVVETTCGGEGGLPVKEGYGIDQGYGGFQPDKPSKWTRWKWYIIAGLSVVVGGLAFGFFRKK